MPMMNGTETLGAIKGSSRFSGIQVVIYSTYSDRNLQEKCRSLGASMVLAKPSSMKEYEATIERLLKVI
jgi:DNA-binding NarL/FixJ family response regulator